LLNPRKLLPDKELALLIGYVKNLEIGALSGVKLQQEVHDAVNTLVSLNKNREF
jgi:hypothetical protein